MIVVGVDGSESSRSALAWALAETSARERSIVHGSPADVLIEAAEDAELLVVGSHGHGAVAALFLGSVSMRCAQLAPCPVVIVRHDVALAEAA